jgi:hypothetical protein
MTYTPRRRRPQARLVEPRNATAIAVEGSVSPADLGVGLIVDCVDTADMVDGQPLPPVIDDDCVVSRVVSRNYRPWRRFLIDANKSLNYQAQEHDCAL